MYNVNLSDAELELFGSSANGFGSRYSDLDICLLLPCMRLEKVLWIYMHSVCLYTHTGGTMLPVFV